MKGLSKLEAPSKHQVIYPMPAQCLPIVYDAVPTLSQHWINIWCLLGSPCTISKCLVNLWQIDVEYYFPDEFFHPPPPPPFRQFSSFYFILRCEFKLRIRTGLGNPEKSLNLKNKNPGLESPGILIKVLASRILISEKTSKNLIRSWKSPGI